MGLMLIKRQENHVLGIWEIKENLEEVIEIYNKSIPQEFKSEKRQLEYILTRLLLKQIDKNLRISYNEFGAPKLNDGRKRQTFVHIHTFVTKQQFQNNCGDFFETL